MLFLLTVILCPLALAATLRRQDLPEGATTLTVFQEASSSNTSVGVIEQKCLVLVDDPSQRYCMVVVDGQVESDGVGTTGSALMSSLPSVTSSSTNNISESTLSGSTPTAETASSSSSDLSSSAPAPSTTASTSRSSTSGAFTVAPTSTETLSASVELISSLSVSDNLSTMSASPSVPFAATTESSPTSNAIPSDSITASSTVDSTLPFSSEPRSNDSVLTITRVPSASLLNPASTSTSPASADLAAAAASITAIPGQKMQVLPIGLGVFGGLAVITLAVVGYVLYERRKYKRQFRSRKLAEGLKYGSA